MRRLLLAMAGISLLLFGIAFVAVNYQREARTISVADDSQTQLVFYELPSRIVVLDAPTGRLLQQLGLQAKVVGVSAEAATDYPAVEQLGALAKVDPLAIVALRPDLVVLGPSSTALGDKLRQGGVSVWITSPANLEQLLSGIVRLGTVIGAGDQATAISDQLAGQLQGLKTSTMAAQPVTALFWLDEQLTAAGQGTLPHDLLALAGGKNIVPSSGLVPFTLEEARLAAPRLIFAPAPLAVNPAVASLVTWPVTDALTGNVIASTASPVITVPADFFPITWENVYARAEWLQQQLAAGVVR